VVIGWLLTYAVRAITQNMTYNRQIEEYKTAVLKKQWESLSPEEQAKILAELDQEP
jgi:SNF family Na+-dependent transporter